VTSYSAKGAIQVSTFVTTSQCDNVGTVFSLLLFH